MIIQKKLAYQRHVSALNLTLNLMAAVSVHLTKNVFRVDGLSKLQIFTEQALT